MVRVTFVALITIAVAGPMVSALEAQTGGAEAVAIVVHPQVPIDDLSFDQLKSTFLAEQQHWRQDRSRITLLVRAAIAPERDCGLDRDLRQDRGPLPTVLDREDVSQRGGVGAQDRVQHRHAT